jgi:Tol biopolymer transport system component
MKSIVSVLSIIALGFALVGCPSSGGGGGGGSTQAFAIATTAADFGVVDNAYTSTLAVTGGTAPFTWTVSSGVLPDGLSLDGATGVVSGTPTLIATGNSAVVFVVKDSTGMTATGSVLFAVHPRTDRVSVDSNGTAGSGASSTPSINSDGSLVAFVSLSANFVTGVNGSQIYVHNRQTNQIEVISRDSDTTVINEGGGVSTDPAISADGRFVAFVSQSSNLVPGISGQQVYLRDRQTGQTTLVSSDSSGVTSNGLVNSSPAISGSGQSIVFVSNGTNVVTGVTGQQIYLHDRVTGSTSLISKNNNVTPAPGDGNSVTPAISADGRYIVFASVATNLGAAGGNQQIFIHDRFTGVNGTTSLISKDSGATEGNGNSSTPSVSDDGRFVAFVSVAANIVGGFSGQQVYAHDRNTGANGTNSLISQDNSGTPNAGNQNSSAPSISSSGRYVAFMSLATNLETGVSGQQIYLHDRNGPTTSLVSRDNTGSLVEGNAPSDTPSINGNGGFVAFFSQATNLVAGSGSHIYVRALP